MRLINNYEGASIDIIQNDEQKRDAIVSLKKEGNAYSNYYNFKVENSSEREGLIHIKNYNNLLYSNDSYLPFVKTSDSEFKKMDENRVLEKDDELVIKILPYDNLEISVYPRYIEDDLNKFLDSIKQNKQVKIFNGIIKKIVIGDPKLEIIAITARIHPGETISSFFLEGIINQILDNFIEYSKYCYVIFPMVNIDGVKNGNHRYNNNVDYNRIWGMDDNVKEINFIKNEINKYNICMFIDVHGDEISKIDYIRTNRKFIVSKLNSFKVLSDHSKLRRFIRAIVKQRKIIDLSLQSAREYVSKKYKCIGLLVELSLIENDIQSSREKGSLFIKELVVGVKNEEECNNSCKKYRKSRKLY